MFRWLRYNSSIVAGPSVGAPVRAPSVSPLPSNASSRGAPPRVWQHCAQNRKMRICHSGLAPTHSRDGGSFRRNSYCYVCCSPLPLLSLQHPAPLRDPVGPAWIPPRRPRLTTRARLLLCPFLPVVISFFGSLIFVFDGNASSDIPLFCWPQVASFLAQLWF